MPFTFTAVATALLATAAFVVGQGPTDDFDSVFQPSKDQVVYAGKTVEIAWSIINEAKYKDTKVDIEILGGKSFDKLQSIDVIASGIANSDLKYSWKVNPSLGSDKQYGIRVFLASDKEVYQWSPPFTIQKAEGGSIDAGQDISATTSSGGLDSSSITVTPTIMSTRKDVSPTLVQTTTNTAVVSINTSTIAHTIARTSSKTTGIAPTSTPTAAAQRVAPGLVALGGAVVALFGL